MTKNKAIEKVLDLARGEIGYHEKANNKNLDDKSANKGGKNYTKYARDLDAIGYIYNSKKQGGAWCDMFVDWLHVQAWGPKLALKVLYQPKYSSGAGCLYSARYYMAAKRFYRDPKPGDQAFFTNGVIIGHTGIVETVTSKDVTIIEGNNGNCVSRHTYKLGTFRIAGYGRPDYELAAASYGNKEAIVEVERTLKNGCKGDDVRQLQERLMSLGYNFAYGADGSFGTETARAVKQFQKDHALKADGVVGERTRAALKDAINNIINN